MDKETASRLIEENLLTIYGWSFSRLYDKAEAEDLTQDIIVNVLKSIDRLENDDAFYGFLWKIAENIFRARLRKKKTDTVEWNQDYEGIDWMTPEEKCINEEEVQTLRRELSLLVRQYREVTVRYYIHGKSCSEISTELDISVEMVKYYLFKTRKILKEGISMNRKFGEMSYNPRTFRMDFWGNNDSDIYWELFKRKLPGNILLAVYEKPLTLTELSLELGVATAYLEDEVDILESHDILKQVGDKYQTNIVIFTSKYESCVMEKSRAVYEMSAQLFHQLLEETLPQIKGLELFENDLDDNDYKWIFSNMALYFSARRFDQTKRESLGQYPLLSNGSSGFIFGYDNDYENRCFNGIYEHSSWGAVVNYRFFEACQHWEPHNRKTLDAMLDAIYGRKADEENDELIRMIEEGFILSDKGQLSPNFPVFSVKALEKIQVLLEPLLEVACDCMTIICDIAAEILKNHVPKSLKSRCEQMAYIRYHHDVMAYIMKAMVERGQLVIPDKKANLCMFGVKSEAYEEE